MKVRVAYTTTVGDDYRRAINAYNGKPGLASRAEVVAWLMKFGDSMDDEIMRSDEDDEEITLDDWQAMTSERQDALITSGWHPRSAA